MRRFTILVVLALMGAACSQPVVLDAYPGESWTGPGGTDVPSEVLALYDADCPAWPGAGYLDVLYPLDGSGEQEWRRYARDPEHVLPTVELLVPYDARSALSSDARFTGYETDRFMLFIGADHEIYLYLVDGPRVEALPRVEDTLDCPGE